MRFISIVFLGLILASAIAPPDKRLPSTAPTVPGYQPAWSDEFNIDGPPDPANWVYETGFVRNQEAQWYQAKNVECRGGMLVIEARRERVANPKFERGAADWRMAREFAEYSSASVKTRGKHEWTFGRFEMCARIDTRAGLWPAFWTVGTKRPWPGCGEIDIMEYFRGILLANAAWASPKAGAAVWDDSKTPLAKLPGQRDAAAWSREFHIWRMDWTEREIRLLVDDSLLNTIDLSRTINESPDHANPFFEPHHIILNLAIGGESGGDPAKTAFPATFEVDWVRVYQNYTPASSPRH